MTWLPPKEPVETFEKDPRETVEQLLAWANGPLSDPSDAHNGLPPCPFAADALKHGAILIHVSAGLTPIYNIKLHPPMPRTAHVVLVPTDKLTPDDFSAILAEQNSAHFGHWLSAAHPQALPEGDVWQTYPWQDVGMFLVQGLASLSEASAMIAADGYYEKADDRLINLCARRDATATAWRKIETAIPWHCLGAQFSGA